MLMMGKVSLVSMMCAGSLRSITASRPRVHSQMSFVALQFLRQCLSHGTVAASYFHVAYLRDI